MWFTWDGTNLVEQEHSGGRALTWDVDPQTFRPLTQVERVAAASQEWVDEQFYSIITDQIGTPTELVDHTGELAWHAQTTLWGQAMHRLTERASTPLRFPGQYFDAETGPHYNYFRYYDPETGRYASADPLGLAPAPNPHSYVDNPAIWMDPLGLTPCTPSSVQNDPAKLAEHNRLAKKYGKDGFQELGDGRIRYYGKTREPATPGEMRGARTVREYDPRTGQSRMWQETLDHEGRIRQVRPHTSGPKVHYSFDADGNYTGKWWRDADGNRIDA